MGWWEIEEEIIKKYKNDNEWKEFVKNAKGITKEFVEVLDFYKSPKVKGIKIQNCTFIPQKISSIKEEFEHFLKDKNLISHYFLLCKAENKINENFKKVKCIGVLVKNTLGILIEVEVFRCKGFKGFHPSLSIQLIEQDDNFKRSIENANKYAEKKDKNNGYVFTIAPLYDTDKERLKDIKKIEGESLSALLRLSVKSHLKSFPLDSNYVLTGGGSEEDVTPIDGLEFKYLRVKDIGKILVCAHHNSLEGENVVFVKDLEEAFSRMTRYTEAWVEYHKKLQEKLQKLPWWLVNKTLHDVYISRHLPLFEGLREKLSSTEREKDLEERMKREITIQDTGLLEKKKAVIVGDMGAGKTTLSQMLGDSKIKDSQKKLKDGENIRKLPVTLFVPLKSREFEKEVKKEKIIEEGLKYVYGKNIPEERLILKKGNNFVFILDALDEYPGNIRQLLGVIRDLLSEGHKVYLTSRRNIKYEEHEGEISQIFEGNIFTLKPLSLEEMKELMIEKKLIDDEGRNYLKTKLGSDEPLKLIQYAPDLLTNPLMLTFLCKLVNDKKLFENRETKRLNRAVIMEKVLKRFWKWSEEKFEQEELPGPVKDLWNILNGVQTGRDYNLFLILGGIAYDSFVIKNMERIFSPKKINKGILKSIVEKITLNELKKGYLTEEIISDDLITLLVLLGYLISYENDYCSFLLPAIQEYFAAWWVAENLEKEDVKTKLEEIILDRHSPPFFIGTSYDEFLLFLSAILANKDKNKYEEYLRYIWQQLCGTTFLQ